MLKGLGKDFRAIAYAVREAAAVADKQRGGAEDMTNGLMISQAPS